MPVQISRGSQLLIALIILSFIIGWFTYFRHERPPEETRVPTQRAIGHAIGQIQSYRPELYISPWSEAARLNVENIEGIDEIKRIDDVAVALLSGSAYDVRQALKGEDVDVEAIATIVILEPVDFLLENGSRKSLPIAPFRARLDPINQIGEKILFEILADVSDTVEGFRASPKGLREMREVRLNNSNTVCTQNFSIEFSIPWDEREINLSAIANATNATIDYAKNDSITFETLSEEQRMAAANITYIVELGNGFAIVNTTKKDVVVGDFAKFNVSVHFPNSTLKLYGGEDVLAAAEKLPWDRKVKRLCFAHIIEIDGLLLKRDARAIELYLARPEGNATLEISRIGRLIDSVEVLSVNE